MMTYKYICFFQMLMNAVLQEVIHVTRMPCAQIPKAHTSAVVKKDLWAMDFRVYVRK